MNFFRLLVNYNHCNLVAVVGFGDVQYLRNKSEKKDLFTSYSDCELSLGDVSTNLSIPLFL